MNQEAADGCLVHARLMSLLIAGFTALSCVALWVTGTRAAERVEDEAINARMAEALPVLVRTPPGSTLMARKPNLGFPRRTQICVDPGSANAARTLQRAATTPRQRALSVRGYRRTQAAGGHGRVARARPAT